MQITADISKISKTPQRDLNFIFNFVPDLIFWATENFVVSQKMTFLENEAT